MAKMGRIALDLNGEEDRWGIGRIEEEAKTADTKQIVEKEDDTKAQETAFRTVQEPDYRNCQIPIDLLDYAPEEYNFFPRPSDDVVRSIIWDMLIHGQTNPLIVWKQPDGRHMVLSGNTRLFVFNLIKEYNYNDRAKDFSTACCHLYEYESLTETDAKRIVIAGNMTQRAQESPSLVFRSAIALRKYYGEDKRAGRKKGVSTVTIRDLVALQTGISAPQVGRMFQLETLDERFLDIWDTHSVTSQWLYSIAKLPGDLQDFIYRKELYLKKLTTKQFSRLEKAKTEEEVMDVINEPEHYRISTHVELPYKLPKSYKPLMLCANETELEDLKSIIMEATRDNPRISSDTRKYLQDILR